jgi:hypothetical protein
MAQHIPTPELRIKWRDSSERRSAKALMQIVAAALFVLFASALAAIIFNQRDSSPVMGTLRLVIVPALSFAIVVYWLGFSYRFNNALREFLDRMQIELALDHVNSHWQATGRDSSGISFETLWAETQERLTIYHQMATGQSAKSYRNSQGAIVAGFAVLILTTIVSSFTSSTTGALAAGGIAAVGAALTGYLTRTFMRMHELSSRQLRSYFDQPLDLSRSLAAERLLGQINDEARRAEAVVEVIRASYRASDARAADSTTKGKSRVKRRSSEARADR